MKNKIKALKNLWIFAIFVLLISGCVSKNKPKTFEPYKIEDSSYLEKVKNDLSSPYSLDLDINKEYLFGSLKDAKVKLVDFKEVDEIDFPGDGKLKAGENSRILYFHLKIKRLSGEYTNHIINANILGLACDESFSYCYSLDFRSRNPEKGNLVGTSERDFYVAGFVPANESLKYAVFYYVFYEKGIGYSPSESFYFARFKLPNRQK